MTSPHPSRTGELAGTVLDGRYAVAELIGRGGMASVYRAEDTALGRQVAVKVFRAAEAFDDPDRRRSEVALLASLAHPALVTLHDAGRDEASGVEFLVMELVEGPDLRAHLATNGPLEAASAAVMLAELAEALHTIHGRGIVHRDVKPGNVLLAPSALPGRPWRAKLADFGIARLVDDTRLTATGTLIGTPGYLSPEQVRGDGARDVSDVYALGLMILEARSGRPAFPGPAVEAAGARLVRDPELPDGLSPAWRELLAAMTSRDPDARPSALEVAVRAAGLDSTSPRMDAAGDATPATPPPTAVLPEAVAATRVLPDATRVLPDETRILTDATRVLPADAPSPAAPASRPRRRMPWLIALGAAAVAAVAAIVGIPMLTAAPPAPEPIPSLPGELGVHLEQLEEAVTP